MPEATRPALAVLASRLGRWPLGRMLLISLGLHAAAVMIVRPRPFAPPFETVALNVRLEPERAVPAAAAAEPLRPAEPGPVPPPPPEPVRPVPVQITATPSPASITPSAVSATPAPVSATPPVVGVSPPPPNARSAAASNVPVAATAPSSPARAISAPAEATRLPAVPVILDERWYEARQLDTQPRALGEIEPDYPAVARRRGIEGSVTLRMRIDEFGQVREVAVEEGSPPGVFDASAVEAFSRGRFEPARKDGRPVRALIQVKVRYELKGD